MEINNSTNKYIMFEFKKEVISKKEITIKGSESKTIPLNDDNYINF